MPFMFQYGSGKQFLVSDESVDFWRSVGYRDSAPGDAKSPEPEAPASPAVKKAAPARRRTTSRAAKK